MEKGSRSGRKEKRKIIITCSLADKREGGFKQTNKQTTHKTCPALSLVEFRAYLILVTTYQVQQ